MSARFRLPNRREHHVIEFDFKGTHYRAGFCQFANGALAELFLTCGKPNSELDISANNGAIICSIALQHAVPIQTIRHGLLRSGNGEASGALAAALDRIDAAGYAR